MGCSWLRVDELWKFAYSADSQINTSRALNFSSFVQESRIDCFKYIPLRKRLVQRIVRVHPPTCQMIRKCSLSQRIREQLLSPLERIRVNQLHSLVPWWGQWGVPCHSYQVSRAFQLYWNLEIKWGWTRDEENWQCWSAWRGIERKLAHQYLESAKRCKIWVMRVGTCLERKS